MAQIDYQIPLSVRAPNLGDLATSYMQGANFRRQGQEAAQLARQREQQMLMQQAQEGRAKAGEQRQVKLFQQSTDENDIKLRDMSTKYQREIMGAAGARLMSLPLEQRKEWFSDFVYHNDLDPDIVPDEITDEWATGLIRAAASPESNLSNMAAQQKANLPPEDKASDFQIVQDYNTGRMMRVNKLTNKYEPVGEAGSQPPISQPPRTYIAQGTKGAYLVTPKPGGKATATPIGVSDGAGGGEQLKNLKDPTAGVKEGIVEAKKQSDTLGELIKELEADVNYSPTSISKGFAYENVPGGRLLVDKIDPEGMRSRALVGKMTSAAIKETSGAAVTVAEWPRLTPWVPRFTDTREQLLGKLRNLKAGTDKILKLTNDQYNPAQGYRSDPILQSIFGDGDVRRPVKLGEYDKTGLDKKRKPTAEEKAAYIKANMKGGK